MKAVLGFLELYLHDAPDDDEDALSIDAASYSSRTTTSTSGACGANDSPNTSAGGGIVGGGVHGTGALLCPRPHYVSCYSQYNNN